MNMLVIKIIVISLVILIVIFTIIMVFSAMKLNSKISRKEEEKFNKTRNDYNGE